MRERAEVLKGVLPLQRVVLFGSYARGRHTVASDIDLLVVYEGAERQDAYRLVKEAFGFPLLEPHVYTEEQSREHQRVIRRMISGGTVIYEASGAA